MKRALSLGAILLATAFVFGAGFQLSSVYAADKASIVRHVVLFKFKDGADPAAVKKVEDAFAALPSKIPVVKGFEWGTDVSPEKLAQGYTHCFFLTFDNTKDRDAYLVHADHKAFGAVLSPVLDKVLVVDYETKR